VVKTDSLMSAVTAAVSNRTSNCQVPALLLLLQFSRMMLPGRPAECTAAAAAVVSSSSSSSSRSLGLVVST